nr:hypothetical protein [uncultured Carboxylicivirga sp.]
MKGNLILFAIILFVLTSCGVSGYELLLDKTLDPSLKNRIENFASQGIEKEWPAEF